MRRKDRHPRQHQLQKRVRRLEEKVAALEKMIAKVDEELRAEVSIRAFREKQTEKKTISIGQTFSMEPDLGGFTRLKWEF